MCVRLHSLTCRARPTANKLAGCADCSLVGCRVARMRPRAGLPNTAHARSSAAALTRGTPRMLACRLPRLLVRAATLARQTPWLLARVAALARRLLLACRTQRACSRRARSPAVTLLASAVVLPASHSCRDHLHDNDAREHAAFFGVVEAGRGPSMLVVRANSGRRSQGRSPSALDMRGSPRQGCVRPSKTMDCVGERKKEKKRLYLLCK